MTTDASDSHKQRVDVEAVADGSHPVEDDDDADADNTEADADADVDNSDGLGGSEGDDCRGPPLLLATLAARATTATAVTAAAP
jgi:hypothetical protein